MASTQTAKQREMMMMTSTRPKYDFGGEARVALRGAGLAWIVMGLLTFLAAWSMSDLR